MRKIAALQIAMQMEKVAISPALAHALIGAGGGGAIGAGLGALAEPEDTLKGALLGGGLGVLGGGSAGAGIGALRGAAKATQQAAPNLYEQFLRYAPPMHAGMPRSAEQLVSAIADNPNVRHAAATGVRRAGDVGAGASSKLQKIIEGLAARSAAASKAQQPGVRQTLYGALGEQLARAGKGVENLRAGFSTPRTAGAVRGGGFTPPSAANSPFGI